MGVNKIYMLAAAVLAVAAYQAAAEFCAGCPVQQNAADFPVSKLSRVLAQVNCRGKAVKIYSVTSQVVAGVRYQVVYGSSTGETCTATWTEAPWISEAPMGVKLNCDSPRSKRSLLGGYQDVKESELPVVKAFGDVAVNEESNGNKRVVVDVLKAQKKVVNGFIYKVTYLVKTTACAIDQMPDENCAAQEVGPRQVCDSMIYVSPIMVHDNSHSKVMSLNCQNAAEEYNHKEKRSVEETLSPESAELARKHIGYLLDDRSNSLYTQEVVKMDVHHVERYGHGYKIDATVKVAYTNCTKNAVYQQGQVCAPSQQPQNQQTCDVTFIMVQPQGGRKWYRLDKAECY